MFDNYYYFKFNDTIITIIKYYALFVSALTFFGKLIIFQRTFYGKLSHFLVFGNNLENELENVFWCLVCTNFL